MIDPLKDKPSPIFAELPVDPKEKHTVVTDEHFRWTSGYIQTLHYTVLLPYDYSNAHTRPVGILLPRQTQRYGAH